jgi:2-polyprenyl-3-methyl-5-hydroxy-6-metoxy-1,4-benzoquinol methylase
MQPNIDVLKQLIKDEHERSTLALAGDLMALRKTYRAPAHKKNGNTGVFWDNRFSDEHHSQHVNYVERDRNNTAYRWLLPFVRPGTSILNVGCGNGKFEACFDLERFIGVRYEGIDFAKKTVDAIQHKFPDFHFWVGDVTKTKFDQHYDVICVFEVLEHISTHQVIHVLKKLQASLKPEGHLLVAVPTNEPLLEMFPSNPNEHVRLYTREIICAELALCGFSVERIEEFIAFPSQYPLKKFMAKHLLKHHWKANDLLILAKKKTDHSPTRAIER